MSIPAVGVRVMADTKIWVVADRRIPGDQIHIAIVEGEPYPTYYTWPAAKRAC